LSGNLTIRNARIVLPDRGATGDLLIEDGVISQIGPRVSRSAGEEIDATGLICLPGVIDPQVHFREPGYPEREDLASGSRAAAAGGVTAFLDMPNPKPATTTVEALHAKLALAAEKSVVHYGFFIGATQHNLDDINAAERTAGIQVFMASSTGGMLVDSPPALEALFAKANKLIAVHAEDESRLRERKLLYADSHDPRDHPRIRDVETAMLATHKAVDLALKHGARLHLMQLSSAEEADYLATIPRKRITAEVCPQHLFLYAEDAYERLGSYVQCDPPVRSRRHADALWKRLVDGTIDCLATGHAPHTKQAKNATYPTSPSGMPGVEWALPLMLDQVNAGRCSLTDVVRWMADAPASVYHIPRKGRLEVGYDGDITLVDMNAERTIDNASVHTRCGWSPWEGRTLKGWPVLTAVLGQPVFRDGAIVEGVRGRELTFSR
jgi:dihydroorotase